MGQCPQGTVEEAGLCYKPCRENYYGVGPVCWGKCPSNTKDLGATCQKESYNRGAGTAPTSCPNDREKEGGLCYRKCREGYAGKITECYGICPAGFPDDGLDCRKPKPYGRGAGHTSKSACEKSPDHGAKTNGCEEYFGLWYPKCDQGYHNYDCCFCTPDCPTGWTDAGATCNKPHYDRGAGIIPSVCPADKEKDALLCYDHCKPDYYGVLETCWSHCPSQTIEAGLDCTKRSYGRGAGTIPTGGLWWIWLIILIPAILIILGIVIYFVRK